MPIIQAFGNAAARAYGLMASGLKRISDAFNRSNNASSLGTTDTGQVWENVRGTWGISSSQASTSTSASTYPIAAVQYGGVDATIIADISPGSGIAFWINDSQNWWGTAGVTTGTTYCSSSQANEACTQVGYVCNTYGVNTVCNTYVYNYACVGYINSCAGYAVNYIPPVYFAVFCQYPVTLCNSSAIAGSSCVQWTSTVFCASSSNPCIATAVYSYTCTGYSTSYSYKMDLLKSIANTITTVATQSISSAAASVKAILSSAGITIKSYSGSQASGSELGTITNNASGANKGTKHGIILVSSDTQGTSVDNFSIDIVQ